jgi:asparagine synthetase B (glutamine-hydrolysing)
MCGIFGAIANKNVQYEHIRHLALHARQRGRDSSGLFYASGSGYQVTALIATLSGCSIEKARCVHIF